MNDNDDSPETNVLRSAINQTIVSAWYARAAFEKALARGSVSDDIRIDLQDAVIDLYNMLKKWDDHPTTEEIWKQYDFSELERLIYETKTTQVNTPGAGKLKRTKEAPLIQDLSGRQLVEYVNGLEKMAAELGFSPDVRTPNAEAEENPVDPGGRLNE